MVRKAQDFDTRRDSSLKRAPHEGGFKPLAIPAVAAAVSAGAKARARKAAPQEVPATLRRDGFTD
ncbi:MAG TPA: hypothetical protein VF601_19990 [Beijerinckiaceae bacterium]|jgi:hypothetical protein